MAALFLGEPVLRDGCRPGLEPGPITPNLTVEQAAAPAERNVGIGGYGSLLSQGRRLRFLHLIAETFSFRPPGDP